MHPEIETTQAHEIRHLDFVDRRSIKNMKRLNQLDPERASEDKFLQMLNDLEKDPAKMKAFLLVSLPGVAF